MNTPDQDDMLVGITALSLVLLYTACWIAYRLHERATRARARAALATETRSTPECPPMPVGAPPVAYNEHRLLIVACSDPMLWYAKLVGKEVPYLGSWPAEGCHKSREPAGFINIVRMTDARIVIRTKETK